MKRTYFMAFAAAFGLAAFVLSTPAQALTCGIPGTEGMPTCSAKPVPGQACCVPPQYKGVKTVATSGNKTAAVNHSHINPAAANISTTAQVNNNEPAAYAPAPSNTSAVSVTSVVSVQTTPAMATGPSVPATPAAPAAPAASAAKSVKGASGVKAK